MQRSAPDAPLSLNQLSAQSGVPVSTLRLWTTVKSNPLTSLESPGLLFTWAQLLAFVAAHPDRRAARALTERLSRGAAVEGFGAAERAGAPAALGLDAISAQAVASDLRAAAASSLAAALTAARQAEVVAAAHREQLESAARAAEAVARAHREQLEHLAAAITAYDDVLSHTSTPVIPRT